MVVFINNEFVPGAQAVVSVFDRCFRYGDGLFEAILAVNGKLFRAQHHLARLRQSADAFGMAVPAGDDELLAAMLELLRRNEMRDAVIRVQLSRGSGPRGYAPSGKEKPLIVISADVAPGVAASMPFNVVSSCFQVAANDALLRHKTCSRLLNVLTAMESRARGADEALLIDTEGFVTEACSSNIFWIMGQTVYTPPLSGSLLPGVTRRIVLELCRRLHITAGETRIRAAELTETEGVFLSLTSRGIVEVTSVDARPIPSSGTTRVLQRAFQAIVAEECS